MTLFIYRLPNDNVSIWLGTNSEAGIDNVLILTGGDILFLQTAKRIPLINSRIREEITNMSIDQIMEAYNLPDSYEVLKHIKMGVENGIYPAYREKSQNRIGDYLEMIRKYLGKINKIDSIQEVIKECKKRIQDLKAGKRSFIF